MQVVVQGSGPLGQFTATVSHFSVKGKTSVEGGEGGEEGEVRNEFYVVQGLGALGHFTAMVSDVLIEREVSDG